MEFQIGDKVRENQTNEVGVITDKMFSEARGIFMYVIKPEDNGRSIMRREDELEEIKVQSEFVVKTDIADNVVIGIIYEVIDGEEVEVCRGHGHIIHDGAEGVAQACAYAYKQAFLQIDSGIYLKQRRGKNNDY